MTEKEYKRVSKFLSLYKGRLCGYAILYDTDVLFDLTKNIHTPKL